MCRYLVPSVQFFRLPPTFPCSAPQLQAIINSCMSMSDPVSPGRKYLQNATLHFLPEASWAVLRPINQRSAAAAAASPLTALLSPTSSSSLPSPLESRQPSAGFISPRQVPPQPLPLPFPLPLLLYVEIQPLHRPTTLEVMHRTRTHTNTHTHTHTHSLTRSITHTCPGCQQGVR